MIVDRSDSPPGDGVIPVIRRQTICASRDGDIAESDRWDACDVDGVAWVFHLAPANVSIQSDIYGYRYFRRDRIAKEHFSLYPRDAGFLVSPHNQGIVRCLEIHDMFSDSLHYMARSISV
jgi:hypothetical protein